MYIVHEEPDRAVRAKRKELSRLSGAKFIDAVQRTMLEDLFFFIRYGLDFWYMDEILHGRTLMQFYYENQGYDVLTLLPRGHCKTLISIAKCTQKLLRDPDIAILSASATDGFASKKQDMVGTILAQNATIQKFFPDIVLPKKGRVFKRGKEGIILPNRKPRLEPSFKSASIKTNETGSHPSLVDIDDITTATTNDPRGWQLGIDFVNEAKNLLAGKGWFEWQATHWHDSAPARLAEQGKLLGMKGPFRVLKMSCFIDDDPGKGVIYPYKERWKKGGWSGRKHEELLMHMKAGSPRERAFWSAQMRNDPSPVEDAIINVDSIEIYNPAEKELKLGPVISTGIETTGGGRLIYNHMLEKLTEQKVSIALRGLDRPRQKGITKEDKIVATLEPIINYGKMKAPEWMFPQDDIREDTLEYELKRLGSAKTDDIADSLALLISEMNNGARPVEGEPLHVYIAVDCAWTIGADNDFTVCMCAAKDHEENWWLIDYDRFQLNSPDAICNRIIAFYQKWNNVADRSRIGKKKTSSFALKYS